MSGMFDLGGRVAVVAGASSGLGADAAPAYAAAGAAVALLARREERLRSLQDEIVAAGGRAIAVHCDVIDELSCRLAVEAVVQEFGRIDILLNNAGIAVRGGADTLTDELWDKSFDTNVRGIFHMCKYAVPVMKQAGWGRIVNVASINAIVVDKTDTFTRHSYNASKAAVLGLTRAMAASYGQFGITVNAVGPGLFESEMTADTLFQSDAFMTSYNRQNPTGRPGHRGEPNGPIMFLSSDACSYVQGEVILVDGDLALV